MTASNREEVGVALPRKTAGSVVRLAVAWVTLSSALVAGPESSVHAASGSATSADSLSAEQVENLVLLGKVWGFAKYHHPVITRGDVDWDAELRRVLPSVLAARSRDAAVATIGGWLGELGEIDACDPCATPPTDAHLDPEIDWIRDESVVGGDLSGMLSRIHENRRRASEQHYISFVPGVGNPVFRNEAVYDTTALPGPDLRLLALYRFWNIIEYWSPYRDLIEQDRDALLREFVPVLWSADDADAYRLGLLALIARVRDGHAGLSGAGAVRPPAGSYRVPVTIRFIEGRFVVTGFSHEVHGPASGLQVGDIVTRIDGQPVDSLVAAAAPYYSASNEAARMRDVADALTQGPAGVAVLVVERAGRIIRVDAERIHVRELEPLARITHDLPGDTFRMLTDEVAYLKLSAVSASKAADYIRDAAGAKVLVIDIRNYPSEFVVFALGRHLVPSATEFARFTAADPANPGAFVWTARVGLEPAEPRFGGSIVLLVDEGTQSQAEYTTMAFRTAPNALVVGSTTAGADGNVSPIPLPGGLRTAISGIGVFYPDRRPTQRVGIVPDERVEPTIASIREGRDEVLEAAISRALGREFRLRRRQ